MKAILLSTILTLLKAYVRNYIDGGLFQRIEDMVAMLYEREDLTGSQKMALVIEGARLEIATLSETLIRTVAQVVLLKLKAS
jgi:hypothetical protein